MLRFKSVQTLGLWLQQEHLSILHGEQGIITHGLPVASSVSGHKNKWHFGSESPTAKHLFRDADFPLADFFRWSLARIYPLKKTRLLLVSGARHQGVSGALWQQVFVPLQLAGFEQKQPADILAAVHLRHQSGLLIYCEEGLSDLRVVQKGVVIESLQLGYGRYIAREIRQAFYQQHQIYLELETAEQAWRKLMRPDVKQVTLQGINQGKSRVSQLLLQEELITVVKQAVSTLCREVKWLQQAYELPQLWLMGPQHGLAGLFDALQKAFQGKIEQAQQPEEAFLSAFQQYLHMNNQETKK